MNYLLKGLTYTLAAGTLLFGSCKDSPETSAEDFAVRSNESANLNAQNFKNSPLPKDTLNKILHDAKYIQTSGGVSNTMQTDTNFHGTLNGNQSTGVFVNHKNQTLLKRYHLRDFKDYAERKDTFQYEHTVDSLYIPALKLMIANQHTVTESRKGVDEANNYFMRDSNGVTHQAYSRDSLGVKRTYSN